GTRLLIALPAQLRTNACEWRRPGKEPVRTKVYVHRPASHSTASFSTVQVLNTLSCVAIADQPTPEMAGRARASRANATPRVPSPAATRRDRVRTPDPFAGWPTDHAGHHQWRARSGRTIPCRVPTGRAPWASATWRREFARTLRPWSESGVPTCYAVW